MSMNLGNLVKCMRIRLSDEQMKHIYEMSRLYNISPSAYVRLLIDMNIIMCNKGDSENENEQALFNSEL